MHTLKEYVDKFFEEHAKWKLENDNHFIDFPDTRALHRIAQEINIIYGIDPTYDAILKCKESGYLLPLT